MTNNITFTGPKHFLSGTIAKDAGKQISKVADEFFGEGTLINGKLLKKQTKTNEVGKNLDTNLDSYNASRQQIQISDKAESLTGQSSVEFIG